MIIFWLSYRSTAHRKVFSATKRVSGADVLGGHSDYDDEAVSWESASQTYMGTYSCNGVGDRVRDVMTINSISIKVVAICMAVLSWCIGMLPSHAAIPEDVDYLLTTKDCPVCILIEADLEGADLEGASIKISDLTGANLTKANLKDADLYSANMIGTVLKSANLTGANLAATDLSEADLSYTDLTDANLANSLLLNADLTGAILSGVYWSGANLKGADLTDADLTGVTFKGIDLTQATLCNTTMPSGELATRNCPQ